MLLAALAMAIYALVLGMASLRHSVAGGMAAILVGLILIGAVSWRLRRKWSQLHED